MFGPSTTFSTPTAFGQPSSFNYFHSNGDYSTWGNQLGQRKYDDYYRDQQNMYTQAVPDSALKSVEQAMQNLGKQFLTLIQLFILKGIVTCNILYKKSHKKYKILI